MSDSQQPGAKPKSSWINLLVDYGPLLVFFLAYRHFSPKEADAGIGTVVAVTKGTVAFMVATIVALIVSKWRLGRISPMLGLSTALIVFFGTMTILLRDPFWIQVKPTAIYLIFGLALLIGVWRGTSLLKFLLEAAFDGLDDTGWLILSRNWGYFFFALAALNEGFRHYLTFGGWLQAKLYVFLPLTFVFTFLHMPMLLRHGMGEEGEEEVLTNPPHE